MASKEGESLPKGHSFGKVTFCKLWCLRQGGLVNILHLGPWNLWQLEQAESGLGGQCWRLGPLPPAPVTAARQGGRGANKQVSDSCGQSGAVGVSFAGGARVDPNSTWLNRTSWPSSVPPRHPPNPPGPWARPPTAGRSHRGTAERREAGGCQGRSLSAQPFPGNRWHSCSPHFRPRPMGPWGDGPGSGPLLLWLWEAPSPRA